MTGRQIVLVGGGARSGKSAFALVRARELGTRRLFVATARRYDAEMAERIERHRAERANEFETVEEPLAVPEAILGAAGHEVAVVDCLTLWISNLLLDRLPVDAIERRLEDLALALARAPCHVVVVTNEVGMGSTPTRRWAARSAIWQAAPTRSSPPQRTRCTSPSSASSSA